MDFIFSKFTEKNAFELCSWKYVKPYDIYNYCGWEEAKKKNSSITKSEIRNNEYHSVCSNNEFIGFLRIDFYIMEYTNANNID